VKILNKNQQHFMQQTLQIYFHFSQTVLFGLSAAVCTFAIATA